MEPRSARRRARDPRRLRRGGRRDRPDQHLRRHPPAARALRPRGSSSASSSHAAVRLAREGAPGRLVIGSLGPTGETLPLAGGADLGRLRGRVRRGGGARWPRPASTRSTSRPSSIPRELEAAVARRPRRRAAGAGDRLDDADAGRHRTRDARTACRSSRMMPRRRGDASPTRSASTARSKPSACCAAVEALREALRAAGLGQAASQDLRQVRHRPLVARRRRRSPAARSRWSTPAPPPSVAAAASAGGDRRAHACARRAPAHKVAS